MTYKTVKDITNKLGVSKQAVYKAIRNGRIKTKNFCGVIVIPDSEFSKLAVEQKEQVRWIIKK